MRQIAVDGTRAFTVSGRDQTALGNGEFRLQPVDPLANGPQRALSAELTFVFSQCLRAGMPLLSMLRDG